MAVRRGGLLPAVEEHSLVERSRTGIGGVFFPVTHYVPLFRLKLGLVPFVLQRWLPSGLAVSVHVPTFAVIA